MSFSKRLVCSILNRADIVDIIKHFYPSLRPVVKDGNREYVMLCIFHNEKTPSLTVARHKQFYHCFGCGAHGNAITFLMEHQGLDYVKAVLKIAEMINFKLPKGSVSKKRVSDRIKRDKIKSKIRIISRHGSSGGGKKKKLTNEERKAKKEKSNYNPFINDIPF